MRLGNKYAAFFSFSTGNKCEFYDSCVKKLYIVLANIVGCAQGGHCHFIPLVHNILLVIKYINLKKFLTVSDASRSASLPLFSY